MRSTESKLHSYPMKLNPGDLSSLFKELDALRRSASDAATKRRVHWTTRGAAAFARLATVMRGKGRRVIRIVSFVAAALTIHALALALADRAYAPYRAGSFTEARP